MVNSKHETCPACGVVIVDNAKVLFSAGPPGTKARLWARVCQFTKQAECINLKAGETEEIKPDDYYN